MQIWKWLGLNDKEARIEMDRNRNWHSTIQTIAICVVLAVGFYACSRGM